MSQTLETIVAERLRKLEPPATTNLDTERQYIKFVLQSTQLSVLSKLVGLDPEGSPESVNMAVDQAIQSALEEKMDELEVEVQQRQQLREKVINLLGK